MEETCTKKKNTSIYLVLDFYFTDYAFLSGFSRLAYTFQYLLFCIELVWNQFG